MKNAVMKKAIWNAAVKKAFELIENDIREFGETMYKSTTQGATNVEIERVGKTRRQLAQIIAHRVSKKRSEILMTVDMYEDRRNVKKARDRRLLEKQRMRSVAYPDRHIVMA